MDLTEMESDGFSFLISPAVINGYFIEHLLTNLSSAKVVFLGLPGFGMAETELLD